MQRYTDNKSELEVIEILERLTQTARKFLSKTDPYNKKVKGVDINTFINALSEGEQTSRKAR